MSRELCLREDAPEGNLPRPENQEVVSARFRLSRLAEARHRRAAARWLLALSLGGFALTLLVLVATGRGTGRWFFVLSIWLGLIFLPLWLLTQAFQSIGPALRRGLTAGLAGRTDRYGRPSDATLVVEDLFDRRVVMPRISTPEQAQKVREAAAALVLRAGKGDTGGALGVALRNSLAAVDGWTRELSRWAAADAAENIQARWAQVRALAALAALSKTLVAVSEDQRTLPEASGLHAFLDAVLDYCDDLALQVEVLPWREPPPPLALEETEAAGPPPAGPGPGESLRAAWKRYVETPPPAPNALEAFVTVTLHG